MFSTLSGFAGPGSYWSGFVQSRTFRFERQLAHSELSIKSAHVLRSVCYPSARFLVPVVWHYNIIKFGGRSSGGKWNYVLSNGAPCAGFPVLNILIV